MCRVHLDFRLLEGGGGGEQFATVGFCLESNWTLGCWRGCEQFAAVGFVENPSGFWAAGEVLNTLQQ